MPRPRFSKLPSDRQLEILERAAEEFAAHGYSHASLNHIITALGLNKGVFYYYFDSKADLFAAVIEMIWETTVALGDVNVAALDEQTFWPAVRRLLQRSHAQFGEKPWLAGVARLLLQPERGTGIDPAIAEQIARGHTWARTLLARGQALGIVRTDLSLDLLLDVVTTADQAADRWLLANWEVLAQREREAASERTVDLWRRIVAPSGTRPEIRP
ncbi:MAG TPA: TetR/AcrR family transcriptional regulator [Vicinamibacterales bacterium]|jgi:AcrR family transcriptional regulator